MKFALMVPTLNAGAEWSYWLKAFNEQSARPDRLLVVDSGSTDNTAGLAADSGFDVRTIDKSEFDHGGTRQFGLDNLGDVDICVFMTQDAIFSSTYSLDGILAPFDDDGVAAVCGRQLPRKMAGPIEAHARLFNYPDTSSVNSIHDAAKKGLKAAFLSNSFAAYRVSALKEVGGFPSNVVFGEDMYVATKLLLAGYQVAYTAEACVNHSHNYSLLQEMNRYFDMGVFHAEEPWIRQALGGAESQGLKFIFSEFKYLLKHAFWRIPEGLLRTVLRYTGFRLGLKYKKLPAWVIQWLAMNKGYFTR